VVASTNWNLEAGRSRLAGLDRAEAARLVNTNKALLRMSDRSTRCRTG
jgi:hypothetical protein